MFYKQWIDFTCEPVTHRRSPTLKLSRLGHFTNKKRWPKTHQETGLFMEKIRNPHDNQIRPQGWLVQTAKLRWKILVSKTLYEFNPYQDEAVSLQSWCSQWMLLVWLSEEFAWDLKGDLLVS